MKEGIGSLASVSAAFGPVGSIHRRNPGWYLGCSLSCRDIEELFRERGLAVDHSTLNRWVLAYAPLIERRLRAFRKPHCGSVRIDETYINPSYG